MRNILLALTLLVGASGVRADDDIKAFVRAQTNPAPRSSVSPDIKEFARYQRERLRTYADAVDKHNETKTVVIVWVGFADDDTLFQYWKETKDLGYHVFVKEFPDVYSGVVVGRDFSGTFGRLTTIQSNYVARITEHATARFEPTKAPSQPTCVGGKCYFPTANPTSISSGGCATGNCPQYRR